MLHECNYMWTRVSGTAAVYGKPVALLIQVPGPVLQSRRTSCSSRIRAGVGRWLQICTLVALAGGHAQASDGVLVVITDPHRQLAVFETDNGKLHAVRPGGQIPGIPSLRLHAILAEGVALQSGETSAVTVMISTSERVSPAWSSPTMVDGGYDLLVPHVHMPDIMGGRRP